MNKTEDTNLNNQISIISHEIRNHLSICDMYSQIIKRKLDNDGISDLSINNAIECIQKSVQIISANLLDLKSLNTDNPKIIDFKTTVLAGIELAKACVEDKNIDFDIYIKNSDNICIDENRFESCIVNIIKNGIQAIDNKGTIKIIGEIKDQNAVLKIGNNGKTIPKDKQNLIFSEGYTTKKTGNGLGLHICKKYLNKTGADIKLLKSTSAETVFEITIPISK